MTDWQDITTWHVLIVDDEIANREVFAEMLQYFGAHVMSASNGIEALDLIRQQLPTIILTDLAMPKMDGWEMLRILARRSRPAPHPCPRHHSRLHLARRPRARACRRLRRLFDEARRDRHLCRRPARDHQQGKATRLSVNILIVAALHGVIALLWLLAALSRRLGDVTKQPPLYRLLYLSIALVVFGALWQVNSSARSQERLIADAISLIGLAIALGVAWRYWSWLLYE
jgi:hypothetical protein